MKNSYSHLDEVFLMTPGTSPKERIKNPDISVYVKNGKELKPGDEIKGSSSPELVSVYEVQEILESRPASLKGFTYMKVKTKWGSRKIQ